MSNLPKRALVTGGSAGLGYQIARQLAARQYHVTIVSRDSGKLATAANQLTGLSHRSLALDLSIQAQTDQLVSILESEGFDLLVNNAGSATFGPLTSFDSIAFEANLRLNFTTPALLSAAFLRNAKPGSVLVNVTSIVGSVPVPGNATYCAAKAGLQALTECLWYEAIDRQIRVIDFRPVSLATGFHTAAGGAAMSSRGMTVGPALAARHLVDAIEQGRSFVYTRGVPAVVLGLASRFMPRKLLIRMMGRQSRNAKYLP